MRDAQGRVRSRVRRCGGRNGECQGGEGACVVSPKNGEEEEKRRGVSKESPQVFVRSLPVLKKRNIFLAKDSIIRNKSLTFALDKTQLSLHPAALRRLYSAKLRNFSRPPGANAL